MRVAVLLRDDPNQDEPQSMEKVYCHPRKDTACPMDVCATRSLKKSGIESGGDLETVLFGPAEVCH